MVSMGVFASCMQRAFRTLLVLFISAILCLWLLIIMLGSSKINGAGKILRTGVFASKASINISAPSPLLRENASETFPTAFPLVLGKNNLSSLQKGGRAALHHDSSHLHNDSDIGIKQMWSRHDFVQACHLAQLSRTIAFLKTYPLLVRSS